MNPGLDERDLARRPQSEGMIEKETADAVSGEIQQRIRGGLKGENALAASGAVFLVVLAAGLITRLVTLFL